VWGALNASLLSRLDRLPPKRCFHWCILWRVTGTAGSDNLRPAVTKGGRYKVRHQREPMLSWPALPDVRYCQRPLQLKDRRRRTSVLWFGALDPGAFTASVCFSPWPTQMPHCKALLPCLEPALFSRVNTRASEPVRTHLDRPATAASAS